MADTYTLQFHNFRSLRDAEIELAPLTVVYGPNGSGKSSLIYGLLTLKNFLSNPHQNLPSLFSYPSISLGGFQEVVHRHRTEGVVSLYLGVSNPEELSAKFTLMLEQSGGTVRTDFDVPEGSAILEWPEHVGIHIALPYEASQLVSESIAMENTDLGIAITGELVWNGLSLAARMHQDVPESAALLRHLNERANLPVELARQTGFVPLRRGFSKPIYGLSSVTPNLATEDEVASLLASPEQRFRQYDVSRYIEKIANRRIQAQVQFGTTAFTIDSIPTTSGTAASIVNEGFGINQLVYMLTVCLYSPYKIVAIEEPEIHLHPSMVRELAIALAEISIREERRLLISTHSETFVVALLAQIASGRVSPDDVSFVLAENVEGETRLTQQKATPDGQLAGGLEAFMAAEVKDLAIFLGLET